MLALCMTMLDEDEDLTEFNFIVKKYEKKLYGYAFGILQNSALSEEAVWDTFYAIAKNYDKIKRGSIMSIEAYLIITLKNCCYKILKDENKNSCKISLDNVSEHDAPSFDEFNKYEIKSLCEAIKSLKETYKSVISYMIYYGYSADQTAELMGVSRSAVYKYLNNAKKILREKLGEYNEQKL